MKILPASVTAAALALTLFAAPVGDAQVPTGPELSQARAIVEGFFGKLQEDKPDEAFEYLGSHFPGLAAKRDDFEKARAQFLGVLRLVGKYDGHERLVEKPVGTRFVHMTYFGYFERQPIRFRLELYKPKDMWFVSSFHFDDEFVKEIRDTAGKKYLE